MVSNYTVGVRYGAIDFTHSFLTGIALILSRAKDVEQIGDLYLWTPWQGLIMLPIAALAIYGRLVKSFNLPMSPWSVAVLYAFTAFSNYPMITWSISGGFSAPLGWIVIYGVYLFLLTRYLERKFVAQWTILLVMILLLIQPTYHTMALALTVILVFITLIQRVIHKQYMSSTILWLTTVAFLSFLIYYAVSFLQDYGRLIINFLSDIYRSHDKERLEYSLGILDISLWWHVVNYAAVLVPVAWSGVILVRRSFQSKREAEIHQFQWIWLLSLIPLSIGFFAWGGIFAAYARLLQFGTLLAIACAAFLLVIRRQALIPLAAVGGVCVFISVYLTISFDTSTSNHLTLDEKAAIEWIETEYGCERVVFTDYRIGSTFGYWGCFSVVGPTVYPLIAQRRVDVLATLLYDADSLSLNKAIDSLNTVDGNRPDLILLSRRFMDPHIGFVLPDERMKPMTEAQWATYQALDGWQLVFENGTAMVLARDGS